MQRRQHETLHGINVRLVAASGQQRNVEIVTSPSASPANLRPSAPRWKAMLLMDGDRQNVRPRKEYLLRAIAVMHVPVDDSDTRELVLGDCRLDGDRGVIEETEAQRTCRSAMVAGRSGERVGVAFLS